MPEGEARTLLEAFRLSKRESDAIQAAAEREHKEKGDWMRAVIMRAAGGSSK